MAIFFNPFVLKDRINDVKGAKVAASARKYLSVETGRVKSSEVFSILHDLSDQQGQEFAMRCLKDDVVNDVYINTFYRDPLYQAYIMVAKLHGVTDDVGTSAQSRNAG